MSNLQFTCPKCQHDTIEMVETALIASHLSFVDECGDVDWSDFAKDIYDCETDRFQCAICGHILANENGTITDTVELYELAKQQGWIVDEPS